MCWNFALLCYYITRIDEYDLYTQIALVLSLILLENLMHVKDAQISKFVPLLLKDLTLVLIIIIITPCLDTGYCFVLIIYSISEVRIMFCFDAIFLHNVKE
jgi:hypothetical protein